jgi:MFS family permease
MNEAAISPVRALAASDNFRRIWIVGLVLFTVRWLEMIAFGVFTYAETNSAFIVSMVTMLRLLPMAVFGAFIGAFAERMERRTALLAVLGLLLAGEVALAVSAMTGHLAVWQVALASFVNGIGWAADNPIRRVMIGQAAGAERMNVAMSIDVGANNASRALGPTVGGALLAWIGMQGALVLGTALYVVALAVLLGSGQRNPAVVAHTARVWATIREGAAFAWGDAKLRGILWVTVVYNLFGWPFTGMIPVIGRDSLDLGPQGVGILASMDGIGAFAGALFMARWSRERNFQLAYVGGCMIYMAAIAGFALSPGFWLASAALFLTGFFGTGYTVMQATLTYRAAPLAMKSRMLGVLSVCIGLGPIGFLLLGGLAEAIGAPWATALCALAGVAVLALTGRVWRVI